MAGLGEKVSGSQYKIHQNKDWNMSKYNYLKLKGEVTI